MKVPFTKAHGARNDFLFTWAPDLPPAIRLDHLAVAICDRNTGIGADGWYLVSPGAQSAAISLRLFNADGGEVEMSGNGTRCAAAWALERGLASGPVTQIATGSGLKEVCLLERRGHEFLFRMNMGLPQIAEGDLETTLEAGGQSWNATILDVGNPQCAVFVDDFNFDWPRIGALLERHLRFPKRSNVSFVKRLDNNSIEVRFFERGVGVTNSSGTGSTGAFAASVLRGLAKSPISVITMAGPLQLSWEDSIYLVGPAALTAEGHFFYTGS